MSTTTTTTTVTASEPQSKLLLKGTPTTHAQLVYLDRSVTKPYNYAHDDHEGPSSNHVGDTKDIDVLDLSSTTYEQRVDLGLHLNGAGFSVVDGWGDESSGIADKWAAQSWDTPDEFLESDYYKDVDAILKKHTGGTTVHIFDHTIRKRNPEADAKKSTASSRQPVSRVHSDQNRWAGENRIRKYFGQETLDRVLKGELHAQIVNVWRPLRGEVHDWPLAFADSRTVADDDWRTSELRYKDWTGQTMAIHSNPAHKWYYYKGLPTEKAILLKCYDSTTETRTPHTAFEDPKTPADALPRWSVEVRALVLTDPTLKKEGQTVA